MNQLARWLGVLTPGVFAFLGFFHDSSHLIVSSIIALVVSGLMGVIIFGEKKLFPEFKGEVLFCGSLGAFLGLGIANLIVSRFQIPGTIGFAATVYSAFTALGIRWGMSFAKKPGLGVFSSGSGVPVSQTAISSTDITTEDPSQGSIPRSRDKILDTSVIIDGRILDIADTHFLDGPVILPNFVLREIQLISDSSDPIKRARGRRGLDMLNKLQRKGTIEVKITYKDYSDTREVDQKLIKLARDTGGSVVTNDFNLNKVAELQGVRVLNLNNLANALKPVVLPGEELPITVVKEGKDENQGIGYLEDGTMVVIENGGSLVGKDVKVVVTSIIQTAAGKMIFTKLNR